MTQISTLHIKNLRLPIHLGWRDDERSEKQQVLLNVAMNFVKPPKGCISENLEDTVCYAQLIKYLHDSLSTKHFYLIEHLAYQIYKLIKLYISDHYSQAIKISVQITKKPNILGLENVSFCYGDAYEINTQSYRLKKRRDKISGKKRKDKK